MRHQSLTPHLTEVHIQRLRQAVEALRKGAHVQFRINPGEPKTIVWWDKNKPRQQHVIANSFGDGIVMLCAIQAKFQELVNAK